MPPLDQAVLGVGPVPRRSSDHRGEDDSEKTARTRRSIERLRNHPNFPFIGYDRYWSCTRGTLLSDSSIWIRFAGDEGSAASRFGSFLRAVSATF